MKKTIRKMFFTWDFDKEEAWINKMEDQGLHLTKVGFCRYVFESGEPGLYDYRTEFAQVPVNSFWGKEYTAFQKQAGVDLVGNFQRRIYWRKKRSPEGFELFSDLDSRIAHLKRRLKTLVPVAVMFSTVGLMNIVVDVTGGSELDTMDMTVWALVLISGCLNAASAWLVYRKIRSLKKERMLLE